MLKRVLSGGQTGVDQAALRAARACGLETGGFVPRGWMTEDGPAPWLADFGLVQTTSSSYPPRTRANVQAADATLILYVQRLGGGTALTLEECGRLDRPYNAVNLADEYEVGEDCVSALLTWLTRHRVEVLNVAGPRESKHAGVGVMAEAFLTRLFQAIKESS